MRGQSKSYYQHQQGWEIFKPRAGYIGESMMETPSRIAKTGLDQGTRMECSLEVDMILIKCEDDCQDWERRRGFHTIDSTQWVRVRNSGVSLLNVRL